MNNIYFLSLFLYFFISFLYKANISCINYINHVSNISHPILCTIMNQSGHHCVFMIVCIYIHHLYQLYKTFQSHNSYQSHSIDCTNTFSQIMIVYLWLYSSKKKFSYSSPVRKYSNISYINHISHISHILLFAQSILSKLSFFLFFNTKYIIQKYAYIVKNISNLF